MALIEFAPLNVPLERRLQTFAIFCHIFITLVFPFISLFLSIVFLVCPPLWVFTIPYLIWYIYDFRTPERGGRPLWFLRNPTFRKFHVDYFPLKLIKTAELSPEHNYIIGCHPHGTWSFGTCAALGWNATGFTEMFPGLQSRLVTLEGQFYFPLRREYTYVNGIVSCSRESIRYMMTSAKGMAVGIVLGGAKEVLDAHPNSTDLVLLTRKGFVRIALETGAHLVPLYNFGENETFVQIRNDRGSWVRKFQLLSIRYLGIPITLIVGRGVFNYTFGWLPYRTPIHTVVGSPIAVEKTADPTDEQIDALHEKYCEQLKKLFNEHKEKYGISKDTELHLY